MSVVIPCLNEAENIEACVDARARGARASTASPARSSSPTTTPRTAAPSWPPRAGARVVHEPRRGYGSAYLAGFAAARGALHRDGRRRPHLRLRRDPALRRRARRRAPSMVIGDRMDNIQPGAMPWLHRYIGNPILTGHPQPVLPHRRQRRPLRHARAAPRRAAAPGPAHDRHGVRLGDGDPRLQGEAAASPSSRSSTTRAAASRKLSSFRDGWRHLRFLLVHSPTHLFILPGAVHGRRSAR